MLMSRFVKVRSMFAWLALFSLPISASAEEPRWRGGYAAARQEASQLQRPLLIVVESKSCGWCQELERTTLRDVAVVRTLNETTVPMKLDAGDPTHNAIVEALRVEALPTIVAIGPGGRILARHTGYLDDARFLHMVRQAVEASKQRR